jgi:serine/threonine protein phosphatase 1
MRTLVVGDIHGKRVLFERLLELMKYQPGEDRLVLIGDLIDRGEDSRGVVERAIALKQGAPETVTVLKGNHEVMMLSALAQPGSEEVELWYINGGIETLQSYLDDEGNLIVPEEHCIFMDSLPTWDEDEHAIYVHASLVEDGNGGFLHPKETPDHPALVWARNRHFFAEYRGKTVVFGHTITGMLFGEREKVWLNKDLIAVDTGAYLTGVLSAIELPSHKIFSVNEEASTEEMADGVVAKKRFWM